MFRRLGEFRILVAGIEYLVMPQENVLCKLESVAKARRVFGEKSFSVRKRVTRAASWSPTWVGSEALSVENFTGYHQQVHRM